MPQRTRRVPPIWETPNSMDSVSIGQPRSITSGNAKATFGSLEIGRFLAASIVVLTHLMPETAHYSLNGQTAIFGGYRPPGAFAVQYFFVLSGFVMMTAHRRDFGKLGAVPRFWWRRACRIYPAYWIALLICLPYLYGSLTPVFSAKLLLLLPADTADWVPPAWSLHYEFTFYLMFGLCLLPYVGRPLLLVWVLALGWQWCPDGLRAILHLAPPYELTSLSIRYISFFTAPFEFYFFAGLFGGWLFAVTKLRRYANIALCAAGVAILVAALPYMSWGNAYGNPVVAPISGLGYAALIVGLAGLERNGVLRLDKKARWLGAISYPLYILHTPLLLVFHSHAAVLKLPPVGLYVLFFLGCAAIYAIAAAVAFCIDQPLQRRLRRIFPRRPTALRPVEQL